MGDRAKDKAIFRKMTEQTARALKKGDKLKMNKLALEQHLDQPRGSTRATFQRWTYDKKLMCVKREGYRSENDIYHWKFWDLLD